MIQYLFLETNYDLLYEINLLTSYSLELSSYEGFQINFNLSQTETIFEVVNVLDRVSIAIQTNKALTEISLYTKNINILIYIQEDFNNVSIILGSLNNVSTFTASNYETSQILETISNYSSSLQESGRKQKSDL